MTPLSCLNLSAKFDCVPTQLSPLCRLCNLIIFNSTIVAKSINNNDTKGVCLTLNYRVIITLERKQATIIIAANYKKSRELIYAWKKDGCCSSFIGDNLALFVWLGPRGVASCGRVGVARRVPSKKQWETRRLLPVDVCGASRPYHNKQLCVCIIAANISVIRERCYLETWRQKT